MSDEAIRVSPRSPSDAHGVTRSTGGPVSGGAGRALPVTTELVIFAAVAVAILIAAAVAENFASPTAWAMVTVLAAAYILSRGLAKHEHPRGEHVG